MRFPIESNHTSFKVELGIATSGKQPIALTVEDAALRGTYYARRMFYVQDYREIEIKLPCTPARLIVSVYNPKNGNLKKDQDPTFRIKKYEIVALNNCQSLLTAKDLEFQEFACKFAMNASAISCGTGKDPHILTSKSGEFIIAYYDYLRGKTKSGGIVKVNTPSRIGANSGIIDVSKYDFLRYTVPMRVAILDHEYSHVFKNPLKGLPKEYESGADINGLMLYLSQGWSESEGEKAFIDVFKGAQTPQNEKRMKIIKKFIQDFKDGKIAPSCKIVTKSK